MLELTERALRESQKLRVEPQLVLEIEGVTTIFGAVEIFRLIRIGDPELVIGDDWVIGGLTPVEDQADVISLDGTGTSIDQQLRPDQGSVSSVSSVQLSLLDRNLLMTRVISPGILIDDILGAKAKLWIGFKNTAFPEDYVSAFGGIVDDVDAGAGTVKLTISHPEQLKRQQIFPDVEIQTTFGINSVQSTITLESTAELMEPQPGPDGSFDPAIKFYIQLDDEIIRYTGISGNTLTGCTRGELATLAASHDPNTDGKSLISLADSVVPLALKIMLSGQNGPYVEALPVSQFLHPDPSTTIANSIFFEGVSLGEKYGVTQGDYITTSGASEGANNVSAKVIQELVETDTGTYIVVADVAFVEELATSAVVDFRSRYDTLGYGLGMKPDQVDVAEHVYWNDFQLANFSYNFTVTKTINGKDFLDQQIYRPVGAYSIPRKNRVSMGYHVGPVLRDSIKVLSRDNIKEPNKIRLRRTINRNFYNSIIYKFDQVVTSGKYASGTIARSEDSTARIRVGTKALTILADGIRRALGGFGLASRISSRYLGRYRFGAEFFESIGVLFRDGFNLEPGDYVILDPTGLKIPDTVTGTLEKPAKVFEVTNRRFDLKTGDVRVTLTDTNFDQTERYGTISPSSLIVSGTTTTLKIQDSFGAIFPGNESKKWASYVGLPIIVHSEDWSFSEVVTLLGIDPGDKYNLLLDPSTPLSAPPVAGYIIDIANYPTGTDPAENALYKAAHAFLGASVEVVTGIDATSFTVAPGDVSKFIVGQKTRVHNFDYSNDSGEVLIESVVGVTVTVATTLGFTPSSGDVADSMGFNDGNETYRYY